MEDLEIRKVIADDIKTLQKICRQTFAETYSANNSEQNLTRYMEESFSAEKLIMELQDTSSQFYFALLSGEVIGYLKLNTGQSQTELQDDTALEIHRIYVYGAYHGKKVGQQLYDKAMEMAKELGVDYVWLGVWEENPKAIRFYQKNGFVEFDRHLFMLGEEEQTDIMMKKKLKFETFKISDSVQV